MALPTAKSITNLFLYGQQTTPTELINDALIRPAALTSYPSISINTQEFMTIGAGRFAIGAQFELVQKFFTETIPAGTYTKVELAAYFGLSSYQWNMQQYNWKDSNDDYLERVYIYNSMSYQISDAAVFVVDANGDKKIQNFYIQPRLDEYYQENFNFEGSGLASYINPMLEAVVDPSGLGRTVNINFVGDSVAVTYDFSDYQADQIDISGWYRSTITALADISVTGPGFIDGLWNGGVTKFLDDQNRPILYGTENNDTIDAGDNNPLWGNTSSVLVSDIAEYKNNGVVLIGGDGNDTFIGGEHNDEIYGGDGSDVVDYAGNLNSDLTININENANNDIIVSGSITGTDILHSIEKIIGTSGHDILNINDSEGVTIGADSIVGTEISWQNIEEVKLTNFDDVINGVSNKTVYYTRDGADIVNIGSVKKTQEIYLADLSSTDKITNFVNNPRIAA